MERSERVRGALRRPSSWRIPLTPTPSPLAARGARGRSESVAARSWSLRRGDGARQGFRDLPAMAGIIGGGAEAFVARIGRVDQKLGEDAAGPRGHYHDPLREIDRLEHR